MLFSILQAITKFKKTKRSFFMLICPREQIWLRRWFCQKFSYQNKKALLCYCLLLANQFFQMTLWDWDCPATLNFTFYTLLHSQIDPLWLGGLKGLTRLGCFQRSLFWDHLIIIRMVSGFFLTLINDVYLGCRVNFSFRLVRIFSDMS